MEFDRWVSSFDSNFWMTQEERNELAVRQQAAVEARTREEQEAADAVVKPKGGEMTVMAEPIIGGDDVAGLV